MSFRLLAAQDDHRRRLDRILRKALPDMPLSALHRLLRKGKIKVDGKKALPEERINAGQLIEIPDFVLVNQKKSPADNEKKTENPVKPAGSLVPEILYEGSGLLVLNKPAGIAVHGANSLEEQVRSYLESKLRPSLSFRPGPLHRLDRPTTGLIVFSTSLEGAKVFSAMLKARKIKKRYLAIVDGVITNDEIWENNLVRDRKLKKTFAGSAETGGSLKERAVTSVRAISSGTSHTLILAEIETGKTHQIRAQAGFYGHPLTGDRKYGGTGRDGFLLHAWKLGLPDSDLLPDLPRELMAPLPVKFYRKIRELFGDSFSLQKIL